MGMQDYQVGFKDEVTYGTAVTVDRFFEYDTESIEEAEGRTEGDPLRVGSSVQRSDRFTPYFAGAAGSLDMAVLTKGFGFFFKHMLGAVATTGPDEDVAYTHTGTEGDLYGDSFTMQLNRPFNPSGTNQALTYRGGKVTEWTLQNAVDGNLMLSLGLDFMQVADDTALASASYPTSMDNFSWAGGVISIGGVDVDIDEFGFTWNNGLKVDRRKIRGNTDKKQPTAGRRSGTFSIKADFESMAQRDRVHAAAKADALAEIEATWTGPAIMTGAETIKPSLTLTVPAARFDAWKGATTTEGIQQELTGVVRYNGSDSPVSLDYVTLDTTP